MSSDDSSSPREPVEAEVVDEQQQAGSLLEQIGGAAAGAGVSVKSDAMGNQLVAASDPAAVMMRAQMESSVAARFAIARTNPRDKAQARASIELECRRPGFAEVARYDLERHSRGSGASARFAELAAREWGNLDSGSFIIAETAEGRRIYCYSTDLQTNTTEHEMIYVRRSVERSNKQGRKTLGERRNSRGKPVYIVVATDEEMDAKCKDKISRTLRVLRLRHIPGDLVADCMAIVVAVQRDEAAQDPDAFRKKLMRTFLQLRVMPEDLAEYLGKPYDKASVRELTELQSVGRRIRDEDEYTWDDAIEAKRDARGEGLAAGVDSDAGTTTGAGSVTGDIKAKRRGRKPPAKADDDEPQG